jgi:hypothetical protein
VVGDLFEAKGILNLLDGLAAHPGILVFLGQAEEKLLIFFAQLPNGGDSNLRVTMSPLRA